MLKQELRILDSLLIKVADETAVPAGQALAVDREEFAKRVTEELSKNPQIEINHEECKTIEENGITIIATGPLTSEKMAEEISKITGSDRLFFYDAVAPIIEKDSIDFSIAFYGDRYGKGESNYINLPMNQEEYEQFYQELIHAEVVELHEFEKNEIFESCMPIEIMAKRGEDTIRFGPLKPVGFIDARTGKRPYAIVQLRQDDSKDTLYNMVGFQTNLKFGEQKRVFSLIPGLKNAEFVKYGVMHRNTYINSPELLEPTYQLKNHPNLFFAGQITGVEGYVESIASGLLAGINSVKQFKKEKKIIFPDTTMIGALTKYITTPRKHFAPMNANFGILPELEEKIKDKKVRYEELAKRALISLKRLVI